MATGTNDGTVRIWKAANEEAVQEWARHDHALQETLGRNTMRGDEAQGFIHTWLLLLPVPLRKGRPAPKLWTGNSLDGRVSVSFPWVT
jgi:hypothetical protein